MAKKDFSNITSPAMQFISNQEEPAQATKTTNKAPEGYKPNPEYIEKKDRRVQLLMQPSLHERLKLRAQAEGTSINNLIHELLEKEVK